MGEEKLSRNVYICVYSPLVYHPCKSLARKMSPFDILLLLLLMNHRPPWLSIVHLDFLVILREFIRGLVSWRGGGLWEGPLSLRSRGATGRSGPGPPTLGVLNVVHGDKLLQGLWGDFLERLDICFHLLQIPLEFSSAILKPGDDLRVGESQLLRDLVTVGRRKVLLVQKPLLQFVNLVVREGCPRLSPLLRRLPLSKSIYMLTTLDEWEKKNKKDEIAARVTYPQTPTATEGSAEQAWPRSAGLLLTFSLFITLNF